MPRHDLICPSCGHVESNRHFSLADIERWKADPEGCPLGWCPVCDADTDELQPLEIFYGGGERGTYGISAFPHDFAIDVHDGHQAYKGRVSSLTELRAIERQSESNARNIPGCTPLVFRDFAQNKSNRAVNSLTNTSWERARSKTPTTRTQSGQRIAASAIQEPT